MALAYFVEQRVEYIVLEVRHLRQRGIVCWKIKSGDWMVDLTQLCTHTRQVGIGGRYDPTNFIKAPAVSVITSIR